METPDLEDVLQKFESTLTTENDEIRQYRMSMYKSQNRSALDQETRRSMMLQRQKSQREDEIDLKRGILDLVEEIENCDPSKKLYKPSMHIPGFNSKRADLTETLMLSEWMMEKPKDFHDNWLILACPVGTRVMLVAKKGQTKTFRKSGKIHKVWQSSLPGGGQSYRESRNCCILDCVWSEETKSIYILDVLMWVNQTVTDCDMHFRDSWIKSKYYEYPGLDQVSENNNYPIYLIPKYNCDPKTLNKFMMNWPAYLDNYPHVDGFLFYHKEAHYIGGTTPLVEWLYPFMVNELLGCDVTVHEEYNKMRPESYVNQQSYIKEFEDRKSTRIKESKKLFTNTSINTNFTQDTNNSVMVFGEVSDVSANQEKKTNRKKNKKNKMDLDVNIDAEKNKSIDTDSAISSLDDSLALDTSLDMKNEQKNGKPLKMES